VDPYTDVQLGIAVSSQPLIHVRTSVPVPKLASPGLVLVIDTSDVTRRSGVSSFAFFLSSSSEACG
jgi:hypothetical protein